MEQKIQKRQIKILFEDEWVLALDKPSLMPSHTLYSQVNEGQLTCESWLRLSRPKESFFLAHRLDTGTSGVLLFAKTEAIFNQLRELFKLKKIKKQYVAWSEITPERQSLVPTLSLPHPIDWNLAHHPKSRKRMIAIPPDKRRSIRGKPMKAISIIHGVREEDYLGIPALRFDLEIVTGVMHQIRVHMQELGFALIGDGIYEKVVRQKTPRLALHARRIEFELDGYRYGIESEYQEDSSG